MKRTEHTQKWLDALRSGEYKQTRLMLRNEYGYCCIGVGAKILGLKDEDGNEDGYNLARNGLGFDSGDMCELMNMNDDERKTFPQIADEIEKMLDVS